MTVITTMKSDVPQEGNLNYVDGALASFMKGQAVEAMRLVDRRLVEQDLTFSFAAQTRRFFSAERHFTTKFKRLSYETPGRISYENTPYFDTVDKCEDAARKKVAEWADPKLYAAIVGLEIADEKGTQKLFAEDNGTIELPRRRIAAYTFNHCGACDGESTVECADCGGDGVLSCPSRQCHRGRQQCWHCFGDHRGVYVSTTGEWMRCPICYGDKTVPCQTCGGKQVVGCGCDRGRIGCSPCHATGWFTFRIEAHGETRFRHVEPPMAGLMAVDKYYQAWIRRGFPGANLKSDAGPEPFLKKMVSKAASGPDGSIGCVATFSGTVTWGGVTGEFKGKEVDGYGIHLDKPYVAFTPFLDEVIAAVTKEVTIGGPSPKTMEKRAVNQPVLGRLMSKIAASKEGSSEKVRREVCENLNGALSPDALKGVAAIYLMQKERFASTVWAQAKGRFAFQTYPVAFLYVFLNVPHLLQSWLPALAQSVHPYVIAAVPAAILLLFPTCLATWSINRRMREELGRNAVLPAEFNRNAFLHRSLVLIAITVAACLSPYVVGPAGDGMYLMKLWFFQS